jgi:hypothetical protein
MIERTERRLKEATRCSAHTRDRKACRPSTALPRFRRHSRREHSPLIRSFHPSDRLSRCTRHRVCMRHTPPACRSGQVGRYSPRSKSSPCRHLRRRPPRHTNARTGRIRAPTRTALSRRNRPDSAAYSLRELPAHPRFRLQPRLCTSWSFVGMLQDDTFLSQRWRCRATWLWLSNHVHPGCVGVGRSAGFRSPNDV